MNSGLFDELIQLSLFIFPFRNIKHIINPFWSESTKNINFILVFILFSIHLIENLCFTLKLFLNSSFYLNGNNLILFTKLNDLFLDFHMHLEFLKQIISHPSINLFKELDSLRFSSWFCRTWHKLQVLIKSFHSFHTLNSIIVE